MTPAPFQVNDERLEDGVLLLTVRGELDLDTAPQLEKPLDACVADGGEEAAVLIDLAGCEFIDSTGIAVIVRAWQRIDRAGGKGNGRLVICCSNDQVERLLKITGVESSISMHRGRESALDELRG